MNKIYHTVVAFILFLVATVAGAGEEIPKPTVDLLDKALSMTKQLIVAATPIVQKAYNAGLLTLQIDAIQDIIMSLLFAVAAFLFYKLMRWGHADDRLGDEFLPFSASFVGLLGSAVCCIIAVTGLFSVWLWVKLFNPELWLVHMAIQKLVN